MIDICSLSVVNDGFLLKLNITDLSQQFVTTTETTDRYLEHSLLQPPGFYGYMLCLFQPKKGLCSPQIQEFKQNGKPYIQFFFTNSALKCLMCGLM